eukprot:TRINITY_DN37207_c0_g1_i1.p1 TRINITY_DN37207_c0_g1~~TRINITY_DN37207_c0_g1_i1.p1  ORF type:complete len:505 (+),score=135.31 TRINITY_DN37207_c0_g1_i1:44-1558(+)
MPTKTDMWLNPGVGCDWSALEKMLDGDGTEDKVLNEGLADNYWGKGVSAHFWGQSECPVSRPVAGVVELAPSDDWKKGSASWLVKAIANKQQTHQKVLTGAKWPLGSPSPVDANRILGTIPAPPGQKNVISGQASFKGLFIGPLDSSSKEKVRKAAHDDFLADMGTNVHIHNMKSCSRGTTFNFHVDSSDKDVAALLEKCKKSFATLRAQTLKELMKSFGFRPMTFVVDTSGCMAVSRKKPLVRGDPRTGAASDDYDLGKSATGVKGTKLTKYSDPVRSDMTTTPKKTGVATPEKKTPKRLTPNEQKFSQVAKEVVENQKPLTPAEKRKALLGKVMHKAKVHLTQIESETPYVPATHELQQRKVALSTANAAIAADKGKKVSTQAAISEAKQSLSPPSQWQGALVKKSDAGKKLFENFELNVVDFSKQTKQVVGRARIQNGLMDNTYECNIKCIMKDDDLSIRITLVNNATFTGRFTKGNVITGTFAHERVNGTFKLMRTEHAS